MDKDELKNSLTIQEVKELVDSLGGEGRILSSNIAIFKTVCHGGHSHKLYYYDNTKLFKCYTECEDTYDIYELVMRVQRTAAGVAMVLPQAIRYVASFFGYDYGDFPTEKDGNLLIDWKILEKYDDINQEYVEPKIELKIFNSNILTNLPKPRIKLWEDEGISSSVMEKRGVCYDPVNQGIIIPHYDINNNLIGIRERTLLKDKEERNKYMPAILKGKMYNHPLSFNLYNLNNSKENIKIFKRAIIFESEKACMQYASMFGEENDISVAVCGSSLVKYQVQLLLNLNVNEIIIAFDKQFKEIGDDEFKRWVRKLTNINKKYSSYTNITYIFDKNNFVGYKDSPTDRGKEVFLELYSRRFSI